MRLLVAGPGPDDPRRLLEEVCGGLSRADMGDADVVGPAPLLRLRGRHRSQLIAKTTEPRRVASAAARLLAAGAPAMRRAGLQAVVDVDPQSL